MVIENSVKQATFNEANGAAVFVGGESFKDDFANSVGTELTELVGTNRRVDDSILREEQER